jgi:hypothetical protein
MPEPRDQKRNPKPSPPGPSPSEEDPSPASQTESARASQADDGAGFLGNPGPAFDGDGEPGPEQLPDLRVLSALEPEWEEDALSRLLIAKGELLHTFIGVADNDWRYTENDLKAIAGPLSRILNRYPQARAVATAQDPLALAIAGSAYAIRSGRERAQAIAELREEIEELPITEEDAPPGAAPPPGHPMHVAPKPPAADADDPAAIEWQRA